MSLDCLTHLVLLQEVAYHFIENRRKKITQAAQDEIEIAKVLSEMMLKRKNCKLLVMTTTL